MIRGIAFLLQVLVSLLLVRLLLRSLARLFTPGPSRPAAGPRRDRAIEDLVRDPICHTYLPRSRALRAVVGGREEHFCSTVCRDRALTAGTRAS